MKSIQAQIDRISGLLGTGDLTEWEEGFVQSIWEKSQRPNFSTTQLSSKQVEVVARIFSKHFGD